MDGNVITVEEYFIKTTLNIGVMFEMKQTIYMIGYSMRWHHSIHLIDYLKTIEDVIILDYTIKDLKKETPSIYSIEIDRPAIVFVFQLNVRVRIIKTISDYLIKVVNYNAETYYSPGCMNPDYLICAYPEMIAKYKKMNPTVFDHVRKYGMIPIFVDPERFDYECEKFNIGIHFKGMLDVKMGDKMDRNGGGHFRLYRDAYKERKEFMIDCFSLITYGDPDYKSNYDQWLSTVEAIITSNAYMSYFSKRPLEACAAGAINILHVRDTYEKTYLEEFGFKHLENCIFARNRYDLTIFHILDEEKKESIRENALKLLLDNYTPEKFWEKVMEFIK